MTDEDERSEAAPEPGAAASEGSAADEAVRVAKPEPKTKPRPAWMKVAQLVLPPVLAAGAMGMHWWINVPDVIHESPNDQGAKTKKPDKKKPPRERKARNTARDEIRSSEELDAEWERLRDTPFDEEATRGTWARRHQVVINRAVVEARRQAFEGAPEEPNVVLASTTCRTVRCRFVLRSPSSRELEMFAAALERLQIGGEPAWRSFEVEALPPTEEPEPPLVEAPQQLQITVAFRTDDNDTDSLEVPPATAGNDEPANDAGAPDEVDAPAAADPPDEADAPDAP